MCHIRCFGKMSICVDNIGQEMGLVSVIMPAFNSAATISDALFSLINQTYRHWECVVVDDGSTDCTAQIAREMNDERIHVYSLPKNMGRPYARQFALKKAKGDFLAMLDSDDWVTSDKLELQIREFCCHPELSAVSGGMFILKKGHLCGVRSVGSGTVRSIENPFMVALPHAPTMIRMEEARKHEYDKRLRFAQDSDFLRHVLNGKKVLSLSVPVYCYSEGDSVGYKKVVRSFWYDSLAVKKWWKKYPMHVLGKILGNGLKATYIQALGLLGFFDKYLEARSVLPSDLDVCRFRKEQKLLGFGGVNEE